MRGTAQSLIALRERLGKPPEALTRRTRAALIVLFALIAATRFVAASRSMWDWDEFLFAMSLHDYNVFLHRPHPPGFPFFVLLAKIARVFVSSDFAALRAVDLLSGALLAPALFAFGRELRMSLVAAVAFAAVTPFLPPIWLYGGMGLSDVPSLMLITTALTLLLRGARDSRALYAGAILLGAAIGVRTQNVLDLLVVGPLLLVARWGEWRRLVGAALLTTCTVVALYGGAVAATGSWSEYRVAVRAHKNYIASHDSIGAPNRQPLAEVARAIYVLPYRAGKLNVALALLSVIGLASMLLRRNASMIAAALTYAPMSVVALLLLDPWSLGRFSIAFLPMFGAFIASGIDAVASMLRRAAVGHLTTVTVSLVLCVWGWAPARTLRTTDSPPVAAAQWIRGHVPRGARILVSPRQVAHAEYLLPDYTLEKALDNPSVRSRNDGAWLLHDGVVFTRDQLWFRREHRRLWDVMRRYNFDVAVTRASNIAEFVDGWYDAESGDYETWRWMGRRGVIRVAPLRSPARLSMQLLVPFGDLPKAPLITVRVNGVIATTVRATGEIVEIDAAVKTRGDAQNVIEIETSETINYAREKKGDDARDLGARLRYLEWR